MNVVILLAGGKGVRMKAKIAKQHIEVEGHEIIEYTLSAFSKSEDVDEIYIVSNRDYMDEANALKARFPKLKDVIPGGETRPLSVLHGITFLTDRLSSDDKVILSDAVRPCITLREIHDVYDSLDRYPAVTTGVEVYETVLLTDGSSQLDKIIPREGVFRQTSPEGYLFKILRQLYVEKDINVIKNYRNIGIDQLHDKGEQVGIVKSTPLNFKITTQEDLILFETTIKKAFRVNWDT